jgi:hypothetical protein
LGDTKVPHRGAADTWVIFLDSLGNLEGQLTYAGSKDDIITDIKYYPANNSFLALGSTDSYDFDFSTGYHFDTTANNVEYFISEIIYWPVSTNDTKKIIKPLIKAYPNPAHGALYIDYEEEYRTLPKKLSLLAMNGQVLQESQSLHKAQDQLDITHLPSGMYMLRIQHLNEQLFLEKIIIEH